MNDHLRRAIAGARAYAAADNSDPFAYTRAITHTLNGIALGFGQNGEPNHYNASQDTETRYLPDGTAYTANIYRNRIRT